MLTRGPRASQMLNISLLGGGGAACVQTTAVAAQQLITTSQTVNQTNLVHQLYIVNEELKTEGK